MRSSSTHRPHRMKRGESCRTFPGHTVADMETSKQKKPGSWIFRSNHIFGERNPPTPDSWAPFVNSRIPSAGRPETHRAGVSLAHPTGNPSLAQKVKQFLAFMMMSSVEIWNK